MTQKLTPKQAHAEELYDMLTAITGKLEAKGIRPEGVSYVFVLAKNLINTIKAEEEVSL